MCSQGCLMQPRPSNQIHSVLISSHCHCLLPLLLNPEALLNAGARSLPCLVGMQIPGTSASGNRKAGGNRGIGRPNGGQASLGGGASVLGRQS